MRGGTHPPEYAHVMVWLHIEAPLAMIKMLPCPAENKSGGPVLRPAN